MEEILAVFLPHLLFFFPILMDTSIVQIGAILIFSLCLVIISILPTAAT